MNCLSNLKFKFPRSLSYPCPSAPIRSSKIFRHPTPSHRVPQFLAFSAFSAVIYPFGRFGRFGRFGPLRPFPAPALLFPQDKKSH